MTWSSVKYRVFGRVSCPWCQEAKNLLESEGIEYTYYDLDKDSRLLDALKDQDIHRIPAVFKGPDFDYIGGYDALEEDIG